MPAPTPPEPTTPTLPGAGFRLFGFDVRVHGSFLLVCFLFGSVGGSRSFAQIATWTGVIFVSVLWHELGHAFVARHFGASARIELYGGGGLTLHSKVEGWWKDLSISLAGPFAGFALGAVAWGVGKSVADPRVAPICAMLVYANVGWGALNLVPVSPYDGGHAFRAVAVRWLKHGAWIAAGVSLVVASGGIVYGIAFGRFWLAYLAARGAHAAYVEIRALRSGKRLGEAYGAWFIGDLERAESIAREVIAKSSIDVVVAGAASTLVWALLGQGKLEEARTSLALIPSRFTVPPILEGTVLLLERHEARATQSIQHVAANEFGDWQPLVLAWVKAASGTSSDALAERIDALFAPEVAALVPRAVALTLATELFHAGHFEESARVGLRAFEAHGVADDAYNVACCASRLGHREDAIAWLKKAVAAGFRDKNALANDPDLAAARELEAFKDVALQE